jgi:hypothetical protein
VTIPDSELTAMRAEAESTVMPQSGTITRITRAADSYGMLTPSGTVTIATVCGLSKASNRSRFLQNLAGRDAEINYYMLTLPWNTDIQPDDKITVENDVYAIVNLFDDHIYRIARRAVVTKVV